jgi:Cytochrome c
VVVEKEKRDVLQCRRQRRFCPHHDGFQYFDFTGFDQSTDNRFADVLAFINTLEPPAYPATINNTLAETGKTIFEQHCAGCHGTYGASESYPNLLVELDEIKTDPLLASSAYADAAFTEWYNSSWFAQFPYAAQFVPQQAYLAPPLDGVWATAPYLHNGSVPTLADLLDSAKRPEFWKRSFSNTTDYDFEKVGWPYEVQTDGSSANTFNTNLMGMGKQGHYYGDGLIEEERAAVVEYLKGL